MFGVSSIPMDVLGVIVLGVNCNFWILSEGEDTSVSAQPEGQPEQRKGGGG